MAAVPPSPSKTEGNAPEDAAEQVASHDVKSSSAQGVIKAEAQNQKELLRVTEAMFKNISEYIQGELTLTSNDYKLLEQMNRVTGEKYKAMTDQATDLVLFMEELQKKYVSFQPYLQQIDSIEKSVDELERTVMLLDEYTRQLEGKFKLLAEREKAALAPQGKGRAVIPPSPARKQEEKKEG